MTPIVLTIIVLAFVVLLAATIVQAQNKKLLEAQKEAERARQQYESQIEHLTAAAREATEESQRILQEHLVKVDRESQRIREHYETETKKSYEGSQQLLAASQLELNELRKFQGLRDAELDAKRLISEALDEANNLKRQAETLMEQTRRSTTDQRSEALERSNEIERQAEVLLAEATRESGRIVREAEKRAEQIGGDAYLALREKQSLERAVVAIRNVVEGYGDGYLVPTRSLLDGLAVDYSHTAAGNALKAAREHSRRMVEEGQAAKCDYVDKDRRETAIRFVIDAFNGRVDAILSRTRHDNYGTLEQEIRDAFSLVNLNGQAFRNSQILPGYEDARLAELRYAVIVQELKLKEREEQRRIQEQIREEEKARREYERTMRESAREEEIIRRAMEKAQLQAEQATAERKAKFEQQLSELTEKLKEAEARSQRAVSMAQQTRRGHVYIVSNVGSFGENVYKIGLTRRLEPLDRIKELGDSSVPFDFDVHALIFSEDAPALELQLHNHFLLHQVNKVDHRKEFFRVNIQRIREELEKLGIACKWTMAAEAAEYRETLVIERAIQDNPALKEAWIKRQLELEALEPLSFSGADGSAESGAMGKRPSFSLGSFVEPPAVGI